MHCSEDVCEGKVLSELLEYYARRECGAAYFQVSTMR